MDLWWSILSFNDHGLLLEGLNPVLLSVYLQHFCCMYQWHVASLSGTRDIGYVGRGWVYFILPTLASLGCNYGFLMVFLFFKFQRSWTSPLRDWTLFFERVLHHFGCMYQSHQVWLSGTWIIKYVGRGVVHITLLPDVSLGCIYPRLHNLRAPSTKWLYVCGQCGLA